MHDIHIALAMLPEDERRETTCDYCGDLFFTTEPDEGLEELCCGCRKDSDEAVNETLDRWGTPRFDLHEN